MEGILLLVKVSIFIISITQMFPTFGPYLKLLVCFVLMCFWCSCFQTFLHKNTFLIVASRNLYLGNSSIPVSESGKGMRWLWQKFDGEWYGDCYFEVSFPGCFSKMILLSLFNACMLFFFKITIDSFGLARVNVKRRRSCSVPVPTTPIGNSVILLDGVYHTWICYLSAVSMIIVDLKRMARAETEMKDVCCENHFLLRISRHTSGPWAACGPAW